MATIFVTGSIDGIGRQTALTLLEAGLECIFQVDVLAPYLLTALMPI